MNEKHLNRRDYEKYLDMEDETIEYAGWMAQVEAHLEECELCKERMNRVLKTDCLIEGLWSAENFEWLKQEAKLKERLEQEKKRLETKNKILEENSNFF